MDERVLCFPSRLLDELGRFQGLSTDVDRYFPEVVSDPHCAPVWRKEAETNSDYKQIIPYVLFVHEDSIFAYKRGKLGGEERLHARYSVGIGGHIEDDDRGLFSRDDIGYFDAMWREVVEEVVTDFPEEPPRCVALINDDSEKVGQVHFGIVHIVNLSKPEIRRRESAITDSRLVPIETAVQDLQKYETWSQFCLERIDDLLQAAASK
jgi:predicted NUDIX family phosphoesterase